MHVPTITEHVKVNAAVYEIKVAIEQKNCAIANFTLEHLVYI